ncbi:hypothetical protein HanRHA438_Chr09g0429621 [Helianthus annuus]|nr:hypothetical protein HanRHA438_Chr09g0429621 [Helianthus annuus]
MPVFAYNFHRSVHSLVPNWYKCATYSNGTQRWFICYGNQHKGELQHKHNPL